VIARSAGLCIAVAMAVATPLALSPAPEAFDVVSVKRNRTGDRAEMSSED